MFEWAWLNSPHIFPNEALWVSLDFAETALWLGAVAVAVYLLDAAEEWRRDRAASGAGSLSTGARWAPAHLRCNRCGVEYFEPVTECDWCPGNGWLVPVTAVERGGV